MMTIKASVQIIKLGQLTHVTHAILPSLKTLKSKLILLTGPQQLQKIMYCGFADKTLKCLDFTAKKSRVYLYLHLLKQRVLTKADKK